MQSNLINTQLRVFYKSGLMLHDSKLNVGAFRLDSVVDCSDHGLYLEARNSALAPSQLRSEHARLQDVPQLAT